MDGFSTNSGLLLALGLAPGKRAETGQVGYNRRRASRFASLEEQSPYAAILSLFSSSLRSLRPLRQNFVFHQFKSARIAP